MLSVHTNYASLVAQNALNTNNSLLTTAMERLSTGLRINSAADDAAGLQIATRLNANVIGMKTANRNVSDATSMLQTADGAMDQLTKIADRQKELATQSANGVNSAQDRAAISAESKELAAESKRIVDNTTYAGNNLFSTIQNVTFQIGAGTKDTLDVKVTGATKLGAISGLKLSTQTDANKSIAAVDKYLDAIGTARSMLGANVNRLQHTAANLHNVTINTESAYGRIMDANFAHESAVMTREQILVQAGTRILSRANQNTGLVMGLLG
ncbi:lateral flagellin [Shewanella sp. NFH-SH190041]|uniref:flagellin N-terminal helical domain-containing protein n=1 Tax=Shewanella sp. NFH-SH190041 TaxID=2950245 RepID=UPI0021C32E85|nr:flagellin [Shewanella sp. NFH-SH190041]BDM62708.1 lateral flagellin [Shewanella sp. NFH-SH190041]